MKYSKWPKNFSIRSYFYWLVFLIHCLFLLLFSYFWSHFDRFWLLGGRNTSFLMIFCFPCRRRCDGLCTPKIWKRMAAAGGIANLLSSSYACVCGMSICCFVMSSWRFIALVSLFFFSGQVYVCSPTSPSLVLGLIPNEVKLQRRAGNVADLDSSFYGLHLCACAVYDSCKVKDITHYIVSVECGIVTRVKDCDGRRRLLQPRKYALTLSPLVMLLLGCEPLAPPSKSQRTAWKATTKTKRRSAFY